MEGFRGIACWARAGRSCCPGKPGPSSGCGYRPRASHFEAEKCGWNGTSFAMMKGDDENSSVGSAHVRCRSGSDENGGGEAEPGRSLDAEGAGPDDIRGEVHHHER